MDNPVHRRTAPDAQRLAHDDRQRVGRMCPHGERVARALLITLSCTGLSALSIDGVAATTNPPPCRYIGTRWHSILVPGDEALIPETPTQAGIDALAGKSATGIQLPGLGTDSRACAVADFSALAQVRGLIAIDSLPGKCLASFARTAKLPGLRAIAVVCDYKTTIDLQDLKAFQGLEAVALEIGCHTGTPGLAPLAALPHLRTLTVEDGPAAGVETLTRLTELGIAFPDGGAAPLAKLTALQSLYVDFGSPVDLSLRWAACGASKT